MWIRKISLVSLSLVLLVLLPSAPAVAAERRCFAETNQCLEGRFLQYWEQNGGLPVFGFPITPARPETNRDTGQSYLTQWFERNRFELHPENTAPYDVLLGRLSDERLRLLGIEWQREPRAAGPQPGCLWFEQTGHNVCDQAPSLGFKSYWQGHGLQDSRLDPGARSLALFGLPLTEPRLEQNASGDTVLTQWFERARFEWHPGKPEQFRVLLGLLGTELITRPAPAPGPLEYTALGDSLAAGLFGQPGYVNRYRDYIAGDTGAQVTLTNLGRLGWTSAQLLQALRTDETFRAAVRRARIVTWDIGGNDLADARDRYRARRCGGADNQECLRTTVTDLKRNWDGILAELSGLVDSSRVLRTMDVYNPYVGPDRASDSWADDGGLKDLAVFKPYLDDANRHFQASASSRGIPIARVYQAFNGPNGDADPVAGGLIAFDGLHPNDAGHQRIAELLRELGYSPLR